MHLCFIFSLQIREDKWNLECSTHPKEKLKENKIIQSSGSSQISGKEKRVAIKASHSKIQLPKVTFRGLCRRVNHTTHYKDEENMFSSISGCPSHKPRSIIFA